jgi:hypothetical protein
MNNRGAGKFTRNTFALLPAFALAIWILTQLALGVAIGALRC